MTEFIYFVLGIIISAILTFSAPYIQPLLTDLLEKFNLGSNRKRLMILEKEFAFITDLHTNSSKMIAETMKNLTAMVIIFASEVIAVSTAVVLQILGHQMFDSTTFDFLGTRITKHQDKLMVANAHWIFLALGYLMLFLLIATSFRILNLTRKVLFFEKYKEETDKHKSRLNKAIQKNEGL